MKVVGMQNRSLSRRQCGGRQVVVEEQIRTLGAKKRSRRHCERSHVVVAAVVDDNSGWLPGAFGDCGCDDL